MSTAHRIPWTDEQADRFTALCRHVPVAMLTHAHQHAADQPLITPGEPWIGRYFPMPLTLTEALTGYCNVLAAQIVRDFYERDLTAASAIDLAEITVTLIDSISVGTGILLYRLGPDIALQLTNARADELDSPAGRLGDSLSNQSRPFVDYTSAEGFISAAVYALADSQIRLDLERGLPRKTASLDDVPRSYWRAFFADPRNPTSFWAPAVIAHLAEATRWQLQVLEAHPPEAREAFLSRASGQNPDIAAKECE